ncbi:MAG: ribulose-phosphate 3-epimerase [Anaerotruncus sp.]|nr:ribulose-phosphate 3-epimerase [Anaerotruncus sp.]
MVINAPSLANCDLLRIGEQIDQLVAGGVSFVHIDLADGNYVPNLLFPTSFVKTVREQYPQLTIDVHLMVNDPFAYVERMAADGADYLSFHLDSTNFSRRLLKRIRDHGMKAGVILNPSQPVSLLEPLVQFCDYVVLMSVEPGYAGQVFMPDAIGRLEQLCELRRATGTDFLISVDGAIDYENSIKSVRLGADILITGIYTVFNQPDGLEAACRRFQQQMDQAAKEAL